MADTSEIVAWTIVAVGLVFAAWLWWSARQDEKKARPHLRRAAAYRRAAVTGRMDEIESSS